MPLISHLEELRRKLIIAAVSWLVAFLACYAYAEQLFALIADPVRQALPEGTSLVFITATEPFFTYLKIAALAGLLIANADELPAWNPGDEFEAARKAALARLTD